MQIVRLSFYLMKNDPIDITTGAADTIQTFSYICIWLSGALKQAEEETLVFRCELSSLRLVEAFYSSSGLDTGAVHYSKPSCCLSLSRTDTPCCFE